MRKISIVVVTWKTDFNLFKNLFASIQKHNVERIPVVVICPKLDFPLFSSLSPNLIMFAEEDLVHETKAFRGFRSGYIKQELAKLQAFRLGVSHNILFVDSDSKFIRDFTSEDFFDSSGNLLSILTQDKDLMIDPHYRTFSDSRTPEIKRIYDLFEVDTLIFRQVQMNPLVSCKVLRELVEEGFGSVGLDCISALEFSPFEYSWYTAWLLKTQSIPIIPIEPLFKTYHVRSQYINSMSYGITEEDLSRAYLGVIYNSNWYQNYKNESFFQRAVYDYRSDSYYFRHVKRIRERIRGFH